MAILNPNLGFFKTYIFLSITEVSILLLNLFWDYFIY